MNDTDHFSASSKNLASLAPLEQNMAAEFARRVRERMGDRVFCMRVFGSRARGEAREDSDLDILVLLDEASLKDKREISDIATDLFLEMFLPFEVAPRVMAKIDYDKLKSRELLFPREIEKDGIPV